MSETKNPELLALLHKNAGLGDISPEDAMRLPYATKTKLVKDDPFTVVQYFEEQLKFIESILKSEDGPFGKNNVIDFYIRKEFQNRGSVHAHIIIWLRDAPVYSENESNEDLIDFINRIISCKYDPTNPLMTFQRHKHTHTCYKGKRLVCRFHFPKYVMDKTVILEPLPNARNKEAKKKKT